MRHRARRSSATRALSLAKRRHFGAISADRGAAESAPVRFGPIHEPEHALGALAALDELRLCVGNEQGDWA
jgi:hypothetical protein